jgi:hypothetical protein
VWNDYPVHGVESDGMTVYPDNKSGEIADKAYPLVASQANARCHLDGDKNRSRCRCRSRFRCRCWSRLRCRCRGRLWCGRRCRTTADFSRELNMVDGVSKVEDGSRPTIGVAVVRVSSADLLVASISVNGAVQVDWA